MEPENHSILYPARPGVKNGRERRGRSGYNHPMAAPRKLTLKCPDCAAHLVVDAATGEVLFHKAVQRKPAGGKDFDQLLSDMREEREQAEDIFAREVEAQKDRDRLLEARFREALERAAEEPDDGPPLRDIDLD